MSATSGTPAANHVAGGNYSASASNGTGSSSSMSAPKRPVPEGNPAFRMMGLPRLRLPSRNWMIFLSLTGGIASAIYYDKYETRRVQKKWCDLVSHIRDEPLSTHTVPRRLTIYLAAPPSDGLRSAREHFHAYIKPVLVAAAMDWDVVEGRKEGDVRFKTAERVRRKRKRGGEGEPLSAEEYAVEETRQRNGTNEWDGIAGDIVVGRHTWKEYVRGLQEGWLGPVDAPSQPEKEPGQEIEPFKHASGISGVGDTAVKAATNLASPNDSQPPPEASQTPTPDNADHGSFDQPQDKPPESEEKKEDEKPKRRHPPPYILPSAYQSAIPSALTPEDIGPSAPIRFPHILGFRNTPIRMYRFFTRRRLADDIGREVAAAVLASHRPYSTIFTSDEISASSKGREKLEQEDVLAHEERDWLKSIYQPRKEYEESVWIEPMVMDEWLAGRMRRFELTSEEEGRAKRSG